ncbi:MAG: nitrous oxide-stimulated promoter family protein [Candidatus Heimdallarchaeota archaeon]
MNRLERERKTIGIMIDIYCRGKHQKDPALCLQCSELLQYAEVRLENCPYGMDKPTCAKCKIHCYKPEMRELVREVMRFSGPKMTLRHPILAARHLIDGLKKPS